MRLSAGDIANVAAWVVIAALAALAFVMADVLGFLGLLVIGAATWLVCSRAAQDESPHWRGPFTIEGAPPDRAARQRLPSPEQQAATQADWAARLDPIRFFGRCGMVLTAVGAAGFAIQYWLALAAKGH